MSDGGMNPAEGDALRRLEALRDAEVPDPGPLYWAAFQGRVQQRLTADPPARRWVPWAGMAVAATLLVFMWTGGRISRHAPAPTPPGPTADRSLASLDAWEADDLDGALDQIMGHGPTGTLTGDLEDLSAEEKQTLLEDLRTELSLTTVPAPAGQDPA